VIGEVELMGIHALQRGAAIVAAMASLPPARGRPGRGAEAHAEGTPQPLAVGAPAEGQGRPAPGAPAAAAESHLADIGHPRRIGPPAHPTWSRTSVADRQD